MGLQYKCKACQKQVYYKNHEHYLNYDKQRTHTEERIKYKQQYDKIYYQENSDKRKQYAKDYVEKNRDKTNELKRQRTKEDIVFRLNNNMSSAIHKSLKDKNIGRHWENIVGYTIKDLIKHLESLFDDSMSWNNYGEYWEIDHIIPKGTFNFSSICDEQLKFCWSLNNLRPLTIKENRSRPKDGSDLLRSDKYA